MAVAANWHAGAWPRPSALARRISAAGTDDSAARRARIGRYDPVRTLRSTAGEDWRQDRAGGAAAAQGAAGPDRRRLRCGAAWGAASFLRRPLPFGEPSPGA